MRVISVNDLIRRHSPIWNSLSDQFYFNWLMHVLQFRKRGPTRTFPTATPTDLDVLGLVVLRRHGRHKEAPF